MLKLLKSQHLEDALTHVKMFGGWKVPVMRPGKEGRDDDSGAAFLTWARNDSREQWPDTLSRHRRNTLLTAATEVRHKLIRLLRSDHGSYRPWQNVSLQVEHAHVAFNSEYKGHLFEQLLPNKRGRGALSSPSWPSWHHTAKENIYDKNASIY